MPLPGTQAVVSQVEGLFQSKPFEDITTFLPPGDILEFNIRFVFGYDFEQFDHIRLVEGLALYGSGLSIARKHVALIEVGDGDVVATSLGFNMQSGIFTQTLPKPESGRQIKEKFLKYLGIIRLQNE